MFDHISQLPDCILSYILTKLSIKDFLKTTILSKRWRNLSSFRRDLYFDVLNVLENTEEELLQKGYLIDVPLHTSYSSSMERRLNLNISRDPFVKRVDQFLKHATTIDSFLLNFYLDSQQQSTIDEWISFVIARGVGRIDLLLIGSPYTLRGLPRRPYRFPFHLFLETNASTLKHLRLEYCLLYHPNPTNYDFSSFKNLSFLSLKRVKVDEIFFESLLSNCKQLEELHLIYCEFKSLTLKIVSSSLLDLKVSLCYVLFGNIQKDVNLTSLDCLKLISLDYDGHCLPNMNFNTPMLNNIQLPFIYREEHLNAFRLLATLPKLEILHLDLYSMVPSSLKITQRLQHLKELNLILHRLFDTPQKLEFGLSGILTILQASPLLQKLSVMLTYPEIIENQKVARDIEAFSHEEVKVIELRGCVGNWYEVEFAMNVMKYANKLERIVLSPYWRVVVESLDWSSDLAWFQNGRQRISENFQIIADSSSEYEEEAPPQHLELDNGGNDSGSNSDLSSDGDDHLADDFLQGGDEEGDEYKEKASGSKSDSELDSDSDFLNDNDPSCLSMSPEEEKQIVSELIKKLEFNLKEGSLSKADNGGSKDASLEW
ncbi:putative F-box/LRR-repeat protein At3g59160 [Vicia villosa]|uniref:putative F-box/LRR-repeat protein At3g59160 n=1 Tax=Vicia villosa TaxID=3911 RepID=UPI00273A94DB|nr:putative F-box/LRR-repeat protein At3g59160 [Vicia villosa]